jgi:glycerol-3-phosphate O-acyltransferase / dihydroxyacetone phosphate acyltransferase
MKLYHIVRPLVTFSFKIYFKKIYHFGGENIPKDKPVILSINHPTAFFEPTVMACTFQEHDFYFITRGDVFQKPFFRRVCESLLMIPIYRFKDGFDNLRKNESSLQLITQLLGDRKKIQIFSEGGTETIKRLRPLQKGMARMAFDAYKKYGDQDLQIVPVGFTYSDPHHPRREVMIKIGAPIPLSNYYALYAESSAKGINQVTADVQKAMRPCLVHVEKDSDLVLSEQLFKLYRNSFPQTIFPLIQRSERRLMAHQEIADNLSQLDDNQRFELGNKNDVYFSKLDKLGIDDVAIAQPWHASFKNLIVLILGFIPFVIGWFGHGLPNLYGKKIRDEKVEYLEFRGPVRQAVSTIAMLIQYLILFLIAIIIQHWAFWAFILMLPLLGFYSLIYVDLLKNYNRCNRLKRLNTEGLLELRAERETILKMVR